MANPKAPTGLGRRGRSFWRDIAADYELSRDELELLAECCRALDQCDALVKAITADGYTVTGYMGQPRAHPGLSQLNATRRLLGQLLSQLALPDPEGEALRSPTSARASKAARDRWAGHNAPVRAVPDGPA